MAKIMKVIVTSSMEGKGAYGITSDTNENVYFPVSVSDATELEEFDEVDAIVVPNDRPEPPLRAIRVRRTDD